MHYIVLSSTSVKTFHYNVEGCRDGNAKKLRKQDCNDWSGAL